MKALLLAASLCLAVFSAPANDHLKIPSWIQVQENGNLLIGNINLYMGVTDFTKGNNDFGTASKFLSPVSTVELDSRIWRSLFVPYHNLTDYQLTVDKKLSVLSEDTVSWKHSFTATKPNIIKGSHVTFSLPPEPFDLWVDEKKFHFGEKYDKDAYFNGRCRKVRIIAGSCELEITGKDLQLSTSDMRRYNPVFRIDLAFEMRADDPNTWQGAKLEFDIRRTGTRMDREAFSRMKKNFTPIPLEQVLNNTTTDQKADDGICGWTDKGPDDCLDSFRLKGENKFYEIPFELADPAKNNGKSLVGVSHPERNLNLPASIEIPVNGVKAGGLYFLHASAWIGKNSPGSYIVRYTDGTSTTIPLLTNVNIYNWYTCGSNENVTIGWKSPKGSIGLTLFPWSNPHPEKAIASIALAVNAKAKPKNMEEAPMLLLFGITAVDMKPFLPEDPKAAAIDDSKWFAFDGKNDIEDSILDNSALNHTPAGKYGWVAVRGDQFFFEDGREARFFGFTTVVTGQKHSKEHIASFARRLHALGCNIIRFIAPPGPGTQNQWESFYKKGSVSELDPERLDTFCYFISELKKNGIYIQMDLRGASIIGKEIPEMEGVRWDQNSILSPTVEALQVAHLKRILNYVNPYTGIPVGKDPVIAMVMVENEDSLLYEANLSIITNPAVLREFKTGFNRFLLEKYKHRSALKTAWKDSLNDAEDPAAGTVEAPLNYKKRKYSREREREIRAYLGKVQGDHYRNIIRAVREVGCKAVSIGSNHWTNDPLDYWVNAKNTDVTDRHSYWSHPVVEVGWDIHQVSFSNRPSVGLEDGGFLRSFVTRRIIGKPYAQTEWDAASMNEFRADAGLFIPAYAAMHGWTLFHFHFAIDTFQKPWNPKTRTNTLLPAWDPLQMAMWPAVAAMYHRGDVKKADRAYYETLTCEDVLAGKKADSQKIARAGLRGLAGINFDPDYASKSDPSLIPADDEKIIASVTDQLFWDIPGKQFRVVTPRTKGFAGFTNGQKVVCGDAVFDLKNDFAAVILTSRDDLELEKSNRLIITAVSRCWNTGTKYNAMKTRFAVAGGAPILLQPVEGTVTFPASRNLNAYALDLSGKRMKKLETQYDGKTLSIPIGTAIHYELSAGK